MWPVCQVVDHHQFAVIRRQRGFPSGIQRVVIHDKPVGFELTNNGCALLCIFFLRGPEPGSMCQYGAIDGYRTRRGQFMHIKTLAADMSYQVASMFPADEFAFIALLLECVGQGQATHHMTCAHLQRGIDTQNNLHRGGAHCASACMALNNHSARTQSSGVSISCTR